MRIYVASSWRCARQPEVVEALRAAGHVTYDFKDPEHSFSWREVAEESSLRDPRVFRDKVLTHALARDGFAHDMSALREASATVLVLPCGRSAHLELGYAVGAGQRTIVLLDDPLSEPELMYLMCSHIAVTLDEVVAALAPTPWVPSKLTEKDYIPDGY